MFPARPPRPRQPFGGARSSAGAAMHAVPFFAGMGSRCRPRFCLRQTTGGQFGTKLRRIADSPLSARICSGNTAFQFLNRLCLT